MKSIRTHEFKADLREEGSWGSRQLGTHDNTMELFLNEGERTGVIEWCIHDLDRVEHIGVWFDEGGSLTDYDGVMSLPAPAIELLRTCGYTVSEEFQ